EVAGARPEFFERLLARRPFPRDAEPRDIRRADIGERGVLHAARIAAVERPVLFLRRTVRLTACAKASAVRRSFTRRWTPDTTFGKNACREQGGEHEFQHRVRGL